jgi:hypothetical protein
MKSIIAILAAAALIVAPGGARAGGAVHARAFGDDIDLDRAPDGAYVTSFGGNIHVRNAAHMVRAASFGGDVRLDALDGSAHVSSFGGDVSVALIGPTNARGRTVTVRSFGGDVSVTIPAGYAAAIDVVVECTDDAVGCGIESDVPLVQSTGKWHRGLILFGERRRTTRGVATVGDGANRLSIHAFGGTVRLVRERLAGRVR